MKNILIILLTSLVWAFVIKIFFVPKAQQEDSVVVTTVEQVATPEKTTETPKAPQSQVAKRKAATEGSVETKKVALPAADFSLKQTDKSKNTATATTTAEKATINYATEIVGKWTPVEGAEEPLEFTKYGTVIQTKYGTVKIRSNYTLSDKSLKIGYDTARCKITKVGSVTYLEIFDASDYSGKYKRISQPRNIAMQSLPVSGYAEYIVGKWTAIDGQEEPLEMTKYGTAIQTKYGSVDIRNDYTLNGNRLTIGYDKARVVISEDSAYYYLEIYNSEDFSGRYRKSK